MKTPDSDLEGEGSDQGTRFDRMDRDECMDLVAEQMFGRVVMSVDCMPVAVPVMIKVIGGDIYFISDHGPKVDRAVRNTVVSIQVDHADLIDRTGWCVLVTGMSEIVTDNDRIREVLRDLGAWTPSEHSVVVRVPSTVVRGRSLSRGRSDRFHPTDLP